MSSYKIFETHAHYDDEAFDEDRDVLLGSMDENGIREVVNVCASIDSLEKTKALMEKYSFVYGAFGIHPDDAELVTEEVLDKVRECCDLEKAVAVGEIGLD